MLATNGWVAIATLMACLVGLARFRNSPDFVMMAGLTFMLATGIVPMNAGLAGFSNDGMLTIAGLYILVAGLRETGVVDRLGILALGTPRGTRLSLLRLFVPVAGSSAVINNTPIVAVFIPAVMDWCSRYAMQPRLFLLPLSFIAIAAGTCSLLGSATNVIANGLLIDATGESLGLFETALIGIPLLIVTAVYLCIVAPKLLQSSGHRTPSDQPQSTQTYAVEFVVGEDSPVVGRSVERAGLRHLNGVYLAAIVRGQEQLTAIGPETLLEAGDRLEFVGDASRIADLLRIPGLIQSEVSSGSTQQHWYEAVISTQSSLVDQSVRDSGFRSITGAVIVAVRRNGERLTGRKIGDIELEAGDTLLLSSSKPLAGHTTGSHFLLVREVGVYSPVRSRRAYLATGIFAAVVISAATGLTSLLAASWLGAGAMLALRCVTTKAARRAVDYQVLIVIAAAIGVGNGLVASGCTDALSQLLLKMPATGELLAVGVIFGLTCLVSTTITNSAAVIILFPVVLVFGQNAGLSAEAVTVTLIVGASASFVTAIAYQTNLMVQGIGRYSSGDFARVGIPLVLLFGATALLLIPFIY